MVGYLSASTTHNASFLAHVCARFKALDQFAKNNPVDKPLNLSWLFIFTYQLLFESVALVHPQECGYTSASKQRIKESVNGDLYRLLVERGDFKSTDGIPVDRAEDEDGSDPETGGGRAKKGVPSLVLKQRSKLKNYKVLPFYSGVLMILAGDTVVH